MAKVSVLLVAICAAMLVGCQSGPVDPETSPYYVIPAGSKLTLHKELSIPADSASLFVQGGQAVRKADLKRYHPHCRLEVRERKDVAQTVQPDTFLVTKVIDFTEIVEGTPIRFAQVGIGVGFGFASDASPTVNYITEMRLGSDRQPNVMRLQCMQWNVPPDDDYVTVEQIRKALGELATLELAG